ncbi:MAG TPA: holo-ACP synthase [Candidatus Aphodousia faecigallinarum]|uniref:Holo-[acyl-carrier-protein] synthase n=1 Tax=Candidatus Aphodousia faecigallinarum TaxID=2840677 RepID=A0A9D1LFK2_9BURK|nr:holo-ACP synthase [Candidatus Aphodousia faecigallinarum]
MIRGIGCDVVEVKRVADVLAKHGERFVDRLLTPNEKPLYEKRKSLSREHALAFIASRWAVKEAVSKALGTGIADDVTFHSMEVMHNAKGAPLMIFNEPLKERLMQQGLFVHVSITDEKNVVAAFAVAEQRI